MNYKESGVDFNKDSEIIEYIQSHYKDIGGFSGTFDLSFLSNFIEDSFMSVSVDGVGTKALLFKDLDQDFEIIGHDLFAMCANDVICSGATPKLFADYIAYNDLDIKYIKSILDGLIKCCQNYKVTLIGGETAQMPGLYQKNTFDVAGMCIGFGDRTNEFTSDSVQSDDLLIGITSNGVHSNGFSFIRKILENNLKCLPMSELIKPTKIYIDILDILREHHNSIHGIAHITGGGIKHNTDRVLGEYLQTYLYHNWPIPEIFRKIQQAGDVSEHEMYRVFNMGIGMVIIVDQHHVIDVVRDLNKNKFTSYIIGEVDN